MSDPRDRRTETGLDNDNVEASPKGAKVYEKPERRGTGPLGWLLLLVILVVLGFLLFRYVI